MKKLGIAVALVAALVIARGMQSGNNSHRVIAMEAAVVADAEQKPATEDAPGKKLLDEIPDGKTVKLKDLKTPPKLTQFMNWATPTSIARKGNHVTVEFSGTNSKTTNGITINLAKKVEFDYDPTSKTVKLDPVKGISVSVGPLGPFDLTSIGFKKDANGDTTMSGSLDTPFGPFPFDINVDENLKPVP